MMSTMTNERADSPACATASLGNYRFGDLPDPSKWADCVHCGMCLESCPTYEQTGEEQHSPRGRVHLMKSVGEGKLELTPDLLDPIFTCLDCRACTTACPADVDVGGLIEQVRGQLRQAVPLAGWKALVSDVFLKGIFPHPSRLDWLGRLLKLYQKSGLQTLARKTGMLRMMPDHLAEMEAILPSVGTPVRRKYKHQPLIKAKGETKRTVAILTGCVMDVMFSDINEATIRVLTHNGNDVVIVPNQTCCGALHVHAGDRETGRKLAKQNIEAFQDVDYIIVNAAGCGCMLKEYPELFRNDPEWHEKAERFAAKVEDVSKFLHDTGFKPPKAELNVRLTYHDACHLAHGQGIRKEPRALIESIPGVEMVAMPNADRCCGSAGIYNLTHPEMAQAVLESKMQNVPQDVELISMGNPGCMLQMALGVMKHGRNQKIVHTVQLLDWAYQKEEGKDVRI
ncbi:(Fe-S)-binding protein [Geobacillus jurassicus]|uniref:Glycolate oxidase iron-sulfur subunit n=1 Tax=Geobacillus jurassicus TaxID=235932 RepID=A0ABV6GSP1_9BACL|nr:(Fe-S)-binding protein [Geobacillus jurassicus]